MVKTDFTKLANQRPNYFPGQYLLEDDFELQHKYLSDRKNYHNQSLHVSGIVEGLEVEVIQDKKAVQIKSGSAINNHGELIVLKEDINFAEFKDITNGELYIQYFEDKQVKQQEDIADSYTRWIEKATLGFAPTTPENSVKLAKLAIEGDTITLDASVREYSGISLPNSNGNPLTLRSGGNKNPNLAVLTGSLSISGNLVVTEKSTFAGKLTVEGEIRAENSDIYFTKTDHNHSTIGNTKGFAAIENAANFDALMILGRAGTSKNRNVRLWDYLQVNGGMDITGNLGIGTDDPGNYRLNVQGNQYLSGDLTIQAGKVNLASNQQIVFTDADVSNNLKLQLYSGFGLGINASTLFYAANGNHSWRDAQQNERMLLTTGANGGLTVTGTGTSSFAGNLNIQGDQDISGDLTIQSGKVNLAGNQQIVFTNTDVSNNLKLQLYSGFGLGINASTLFYAANGNHSWRDAQQNERMLLTTGANGGLTVTGTGTSSFAGNLNIQGDQYLSGDLTIQSGKVNLSGNQQMINLWKQEYGIGIQDGTQYFRTGKNFAWYQGGTHDHNELNPGGGTVQMVINNGNVGIGMTNPGAKLSINGGLHVGGDSDPGDKNLQVDGAIQPSTGNTKNNGIMFPENAFGGGGDAAWIRYYRRGTSGEATTLEIGTHNDPDDHIALMPGGGVGIGTNDPGDYKLNVQGNQYLSGNLTVNGTIFGNINAANIISGQLAVDRIPNLPANKITSGTIPGNLTVQGDQHLSGNLTVSGEIRAGNSDLYFTKTDHIYSSIGDTVGFAAIENDAKDYNALMILGRAGTSKGRAVKLWDYLQVNGEMEVSGNLKLSSHDNHCIMYVTSDGLEFYIKNSHHGHDKRILWNGDSDWNSVSDLRLKTDIDNEGDILNRLMQLELKNYRWKDNPQAQTKKIGFIAQDVQPLFPTLVGEIKDQQGDEPTLTLKYAEFGVLAVGGLKELKREKDAEIAELRTKLDAAINDLKTQIQQLRRERSKG